MAELKAKSVPIEEFNGGIEYDDDSMVSFQEFNNMISNSQWVKLNLQKLIENSPNSITLPYGQGSKVTITGMTNDENTNPVFTFYLPQGKDGENIELRVADGYFQWKSYTDTEWKNLIATSVIANVDQELSELSSNAIANNAVANALKNKVSNTGNETIKGQKRFEHIYGFIDGKETYEQPSAYNAIINDDSTISNNYGDNRYSTVILGNDENIKYIYPNPNTSSSETIITKNIGLANIIDTGSIGTRDENAPPSISVPAAVKMFNSFTRGDNVVFKYVDPLNTEEPEYYPVLECKKLNSTNDNINFKIFSRGNIFEYSFTYNENASSAAFCGDVRRGATIVSHYTSTDGLTWYRVWSDGWKECGFRVIGNSSWQTKTLPLEYQNSNYSVTSSGYRLSDEKVTLVVIGIKEKATSTITIAPMYCYNGTTNLAGDDGYIDVCVTGY